MSSLNYIQNRRRYGEAALVNSISLSDLMLISQLSPCTLLCMTVHKSLLGHTVYISDLLTSVADVSARSALRASSSGDLVVPRTRRRIGDRAFSVAAARAWNRLSTELKLLRSTTTFRRQLKTFLFPSTCGHREDWWLFCDAPSVFSIEAVYKWLSYSYNLQLYYSTHTPV